MKILAVDPGNEMSAYVILDDLFIIHDKGLVDNEELLKIAEEKEYDKLVIEMIASYGMPVGREIFETCVFIGRLREKSAKPYKYIYRKDEKMNICHTMKAKDSNIRQSLIDRFGEVGTKNNKGYFYGFKKDMWSAFAVGITYIDTCI